MRVQLVADPASWQVPLCGAAAPAATLVEQHKLAMLFKKLATLRTTGPVRAAAERLRWMGPKRNFRRIAERVRVPQLVERP